MSCQKCFNCVSDTICDVKSAIIVSKTEFYAVSQVLLLCQLQNICSYFSDITVAIFSSNVSAVIMHFPECMT